MSLFPSDLWTDSPEPFRGEMSIWASRNDRGGWSIGLGYWNVSGGWSDCYGASTQRATRFHPMPESPKR